MTYALSWSGGKDATLALDRAVREGLDVPILFNIYEGSSGRVRFHGVRRELIRAQADALGLELIQAHTGSDDDFDAVFGRVLDELRDRGVRGVVFGNIHLADVRGWYEERTTARGFEHLEPLWGAEPVALAEEFIARGYHARVVSVNLELGSADWIGRELDRRLLRALSSAPGIDPGGEHGEYHTFVYDGPLFRRPVPFTGGESITLEGHRFLDLLPSDPMPSPATPSSDGPSV
ncbi:MAG: diphthine--ammonia ligase [Gemmatimonadota bacterium]